MKEATTIFTLVMGIIWFSIYLRYKKDDKQYADGCNTRSTIWIAASILSSLM